jgi:diguanylate cyclase (GGDEF)-like protein/PAS domain S-box-containing protein
MSISTAHYAPRPVRRTPAPHAAAAGHGSGPACLPDAGSLLDARIRVDRHQVIVDVDEAATHMMGFARPIQAGLPLAECCDDEEFVGTVSAGARSNAPDRTVLVRTGLDGKLRHVLVQVVPLGAQPASLLVLLSDATRQVQQEDALLAACRVLDGVSEGVVLVDAASCRVRQVNAPALVILGLDSAELPGLQFGQLCLRLRAEDGTAPTPAQLAAHATANEYRYQRPDGSTLPVEVRAERLRLERRELLAFTFRDISQRLQAAAELRAASSRCAITFSQAATGLAHVSLDGRWIKVNHKLASILGYSEHELLSMSVSAVTDPQDRASDTFVYQRMLAGELPYSTREKRLLCKDGSHAWISVTSSLAREADSVPSHFICMVEDIDERKRTDERIRHLALHDILTGLPNRAGLHDYLERELDAALAARRRLGVVFLDMDKLKTINDTQGHEAGDRALIRFARHLQQVVRSGDLVARLGGDEFVIVLGDVSRRADIDATLQRTLFAQPPEVTTGPGGHAIAASCSVGVSIYPDDGCDAQTLIRNADLAMYRAKQRGGSGYAYFSRLPDTNSPFPATLSTRLEKTR